MGIAIPQVITSDRASGAQVIDGSLKFDNTKSHYLTRTPSASGNLRTWTWSSWIKRTKFGATGRILRINPSGESGIQFLSDDKLEVYHYADSSYVVRVVPTRVLRDTGWYHIVVAFDSTQSTSSDRLKIYINGTQATDFSYSTYPSQNFESYFNLNSAHSIFGSDLFPAGYVSQINWIDGQALGPEYFGYTDSLTNTWKPKKYINTTASPGDAGGVVGFGTNGFYLPMDGNSPIGQDKSGQGNDWTPVNFGGSVALDSPAVSGARPILNTTQGGTQAGVGVFGSKQNVGYAVTVYDDGGGNKYYIDGVKQATLTGLIRGATYTFDQSDSSNSTHPLVFGSTAEGNNFARGALYGSISAGSAGAATTITIPYDAPETLYYHCSAHSGMGADITGITTNEKLADQYASNCVLSQPLIGIADDVSASIACTSTTKTITTSGAVASSAFNNFYNGSFFFDGSDDFLSVPDGTYFTVGSDPFTLEFWAYKTSSGEDMFCGSSNSSGSDSSTSYIVQTGGGSPSNSLRAHVGDGSSLTTVNSGIDFVLNKWVHIAFVRDGNTLRLFQDGVQVDTTSFSGTVKDSGDPFYIGRGFGANSTKNFPGYIQDLRFYKGVAKYTSDFVVPSTSPDILPDTPSGVSGSSKLTKITDGAVALDGNDSIEVPSSTDLSFGSGDFTIECLAYFNSLPSNMTVANFDGGGSYTSIFFAHLPTLNCYVSGNGTSWNVLSGNSLGTPSTRVWHHLAFVREGNYYMGFLDGVLGFSINNSSGPYGSSALARIGNAHASLSQGVDGYISNFRVLKGTALYTKNFTPPTAPLTNVTNTKLLCCQSNTSATTAAVTPETITANGDAAATNFNPFITDINTVRGQETGYPTMNPLAKNSAITLEDGNLRITQTDSHGQKKIVYSTAQIPNDGKWYVEWHIGGPGCTLGFGMNGKVEFRGSDTQLGTDYNSWGYEPNGNLFHNGNQGGSYGASSAGDVIGMTIDTSDSTITAQWYENGVLIRNSSDTAAEFTGIARSDYIVMMSQHSPNYDTVVNFGQKPFKFPPPDGFQPLCAANTRPEIVITDPTKYVGVATYYGSGSTLQELNLGFKPDLVWAKSTTNAENHALFDSVRGSTKFLRSDSTDDEYTISDVNFTLNGFSYANGSGEINESGQTYASFAWRAGGDKNTFNIDNVGYSTAGDANMGIADLNSSVYNQSQVWSDSLTSSTGFRGSEPVENAFDGDTSTICSAVGSGIVTFTSPVTFSSDSIIRVIVHGGDHTVNVNGGDDQTVSAGSFQTITGNPSNNPFTITFQRDAGGSDTGIRAIEIGGKILVDSDQTPTSVPSIAASGCSVGTKQGFSIIKYTGTGTAGTIPHGLSEQPKFVVIKDLKNANAWAVQHVGTTLGTGLLKLNVNNAVDTSVASAVWNSTAPTSSVFSVGTSGDVNYTTNSAEYIAYLWHDVPGLQKFGVFKGNGNANGIFVELGFKPAILLIKNDNSTGDWIIWDSERNKINPVNRQIWPYTTSGTYGAYDQVASNYPLDFLSNGFKIRTTDADMNDGSRSYIFAAWAEAPSANLYGGGANAR